MDFAQVLEERMQADDGVTLRVGAYQRMMEHEKVRRGWSAKGISALRRRSRKIIEWGRARLRVSRKG
jgi:hypothetical protein